MRIKQCMIGIPFFKKAFFEKYDLQGYQRSDEPAIFFGVYRSQRKRLLFHKSLAVVVWGGSDAMGLDKKDPFVKQLKKRTDIKHIAISKFIENDLKKVNLPFHSVPIVPWINSDIEPEPLGKDVYFYYGEAKPGFYGKQYADRLKKMFPKVKFHMCHKNSYNRENIVTIYKRCFLGLRFTVHDGLPNTAIELGLMGRKVISNNNLPNTLNYNTFYDIIRIFKKELYSNKPGTINKRVSNATKKYLDIPNDWLDTKYYNNNKYVSTIPDKYAILENDFPPRIPKRIKKIKNVEPMITDKYNVSIIINTVREDPGILRKAVDSYIKQKGVNIQIIISTIAGDPSVQLAEKLKLDCIFTQKPGIFKQLNNALQLIKYPWFAYASGNDVAKNRKLYHEIKACVDNGKKVCYSNFYRTNDNLAVISKTNFPAEYNYEKHLKGNFVNDCAVMDSQLLKKYGPFNAVWGNFAYWDLWLRIFEGEGDVFCLNPEYDWFYRVSPNSKHVLRQSNPKEKEIYRQLLNKMINSHQK